MKKEKEKLKKPSWVIGLIQSESTPDAQSSPTTPSQSHFGPKSVFPHVAFKGSRDQSASEGLLVTVCGCQHSIQR